MKNKKNFWVAFQVISVGLFIITVGAIIQNWVRENLFHPQLPPTMTLSPTPIPPVFESVKCPKDFATYNLLRENTNQVAPLIKGRKNMFAANGGFKNAQAIVTKIETKNSKVACGYLLVRTGTNKGSLESWENVYINPDNFGGHINSSNQFGLGDGNEFSEYLFSLDNIQYWKTKNRKTLSEVDWAALLNVSDKLTFLIALNTEDRTGFIDEVSIIYKCWNPQTGKENNECKLEVTQKPDIVTEKPLQ